MQKLKLATENHMNAKKMIALMNDMKRLAKKMGNKPLTKKEMMDRINEEMSIPVYINDKYQVHMRVSTSTDIKFGFYIDGNITDDNKSGTMGITHLSIRTHDRSPIKDWRDMQEIKNQLVGENYEAVELFPSENRLVDTANQYHMWVLEKTADEGGYFPFGFHGRLVDYNKPLSEAIQRPSEKAIP